MENDVNNGIVSGPIALHVIVVGFHHKKGMQVEYSYPHLGTNENINELPEKWKHLPSLCLPDGAHNHEADTVYFHLPHLINDNQTVFGVSCYRQIDAEKVTNKTADITRNTVQKSVCVLTSLPIYGYVQERLKVTTKVYFKEANFSDVRDLEGLYNDLNNTNWRDRLMHGICVSDSVQIFGRNILVLFKLLLLERRVLFYNRQVATIGRTITSLLALLPANFPHGLAQAAATNNEFEIKSTDEFLKNKEYSKCDEISIPKTQDQNLETTQDEMLVNTAIEAIDINERRSSFSSLTSVTSRASMMSSVQSHQNTEDDQTNLSTKMSYLKGRLSGAINYWTGKEKISSNQESCSLNPSPVETSHQDTEIPLTESPHEEICVEVKPEVNQPVIDTELYALIEPDECGMPLQIFTKGNLLHPYLSLQYLDILTSPSTRGFIAGASNALFIHKKGLSEVIIQIDEGKIEILEPELKKQLHLSTEDLRFAEHIVKQVDAVNASSDSSSSLSDIFLSGVGWIGGEEWLRLQFKVYLLAMLRLSLCPDPSREYEVFNSFFMAAWMETHNYRVWVAGGPYEAFTDLPPGHPNAGNISMTDMKIKLTHTMGLERTRRLNQTLASTGTAVVKTREAVGGAITSAKGAITNLWSSFTTSNFSEKDEIEQAHEVTPDEQLQSNFTHGDGTLESSLQNTDIPQD